MTAAHAEDKPLIAVVPFTGPQAKSAEAVVVRTLRRKATLVPPSKWAASANKLFAHTHSPDDVASVAADVGAKIVITGVVKREGRGWQLAVSVRAGEDGHSRDKLKYPLKGPRLTPKTLSLLATEVNAAFEHARTAGAEGGDDGEHSATVGKKPPANSPPTENSQPPTGNPQPPTGNPQPPTGNLPPLVADGSPRSPPGKRGRGKKGQRLAKQDEELPPPTTPPSPPPPPPPTPTVVVEKPQPPPARPRWAPYFDVAAGGSISGRGFDFSPSSLPRFTSGVVGGLHLELTIYPLAMLWRTAGGVVSGIGLGATIDKPFWPASSSRSDPTTRFPTNELRVEGGLRWRFVLYKPLPRPELVLDLAGGLRSFNIGKTLDMNGNLTDVGPPDVAYGYLGFGGRVRLHLAEWARLWAGFQYQAVLDPGPVVTASEYGPASVFGIRVEGGLDFFVWRGLKLSGAGFYQRFALTFSGTGARGQAASAADQYFGGLLAVGYEL